VTTYAPIRIPKNRLKSTPLDAFKSGWPSEPVATEWNQSFTLYVGEDANVRQCAITPTDPEPIAINADQWCMSLLNISDIVLPFGYMIENYVLTEDIQVSVRQSLDSFVASCSTTGTSASGDTEQDAVANLSTLMLDLLEDYRERPNAMLSTRAERQFTALCRILAHVPTHR